MRNRSEEGKKDRILSPSFGLLALLCHFVTVKRP